MPGGLQAGKALRMNRQSHRAATSKIVSSLQEISRQQMDLLEDADMDERPFWSTEGAEDEEKLG